MKKIDKHQYAIVATTALCRAQAQQFVRRYPKWKISLITNRSQLTHAHLMRLQPRYVFFPHYSHRIPESVFKNFECVVFHMTNLPFGRGGAPLQNCILRGMKKTTLSAFRAGRVMDGGPVYLKRTLSLHGSAQEIYDRTARLIFIHMIPFIAKSSLRPRKQKGRAIRFRRRLPQESKIPQGFSTRQLYDFIRMLDADGYPRAFLETRKSRFEFFDAQLKGKAVAAKVVIRKKEK